MNIKNELLKFFKSFRYAASGIIRCIKTQRNLRFHIGAAGAVAIVAILCSVSIAEELALLLTVGGVIALECVNTAIENAVNLAAKTKPSELAKAAKDCAAGAVLLFCIAAACVAAVVFGRRILYILGCFAEYPELIIAAVLYFGLWFWWVFFCFRENKDD